MANPSNDASDITLFSPSQAQTSSAIPLPIRGEKRLVPTPVDPMGINSTAYGQANKKGTRISPSDFERTAAKKTFTEWILIRIPGRGSDGVSALTFQFLINPKTVNVSKTTLDAQSMTRAGWQFGVWGEDMTEITMQGTTAGQYFANGLTDDYAEFTLSYRNTVMLTAFFENNGYFFEGESAGSGPLAADFTRRRIKMHQDVQLVVGNFIWYGMFTGFTLFQKADCPFKNEFQISFLAWKERYRSTSPYPNSIQNDIQRGHSPQSFQNYGAAAKTQNQINKFQNTPSLNAAASPTSGVPAATQQAASSVEFFSGPLPFSTDVADSSPTSDVMSPQQSVFGGVTQGGV